MIAHIRIDEHAMGDMDGMDVQKSMHRFCKAVGEEIARLYPDITIDCEWGDAPNQNWRAWFEDADKAEGDEESYAALAKQDQILTDIQRTQEEIFDVQLWPVLS